MYWKVRPQFNISCRDLTFSEKLRQDTEGEKTETNHVFASQPDFKNPARSRILA